jgi:hypothetical protein
MIPDKVGIEIGDDPLGSIATTRAQDGLNLRIEEHLHQFLGSLLICSSQVEVLSLQEGG